MPRRAKKPAFPRALSLDGAVAALDCRRKTLVDAIAKKQLRAFRDPTSNRVRIRVIDLDSYIENYWYEV